MKKILFLPLFRMQSGHHQVAEALMDMLKKHSNGLLIKNRFNQLYQYFSRKNHCK